VPASAHYIGQCVYEYPLFVEHSAFESGEHPFQKQVYGTGLCPVAENILKTAIVLPVNEAYTVQDLEETVTAIRRVAMWTVQNRETTLP